VISGAEKDEDLKKIFFTLLVRRNKVRKVYKKDYIICPEKNQEIPDMLLTNA
jgi:hypothetical protein